MKVPERDPWVIRVAGSTHIRWVGVVALATLLSGCSGSSLGPPSPVTTQGKDISSLWSVFVSVAAVVGLLVMGLIVFAIIRYRRRSDDEELPPQFRYNIPLEVIYTGVPILIVIVLFVLTAGVITRVNSVAPDPDLVVKVTGFQWDWQFDYPEYGITVVGEPGLDPTLVLPVDEDIQLELTSADVIHSFYVPEFFEKRDVFPGTIDKIDIHLTEEGEYVGRCAEFCGTYHDRMLFNVRAVSAADFEAWVSEQTKVSDG